MAALWATFQSFERNPIVARRFSDESVTSTLSFIKVSSRFLSVSRENHVYDLTMGLLFMAGMLALALSSSRACRIAAVCVTASMALHEYERSNDGWVGPLLIWTLPVLMVAVFRSSGSTITEQDLNSANS